jgi:DNA-binding YbaB/EbfC family protein
MTTPMPDFGGLLAQAAQMQQQMEQAQQDVAALDATGTAGGGVVTAVVDGQFDLVELRISPDAVDLTAPEALEDLADLVVAAVRDARAQVERLATERMGAATAGLASLGASLTAGAGAPDDGAGAGLPGGLGALESLLPPGLLSGPADAVDKGDDLTDDPDESTATG